MDTDLTVDWIKKGLIVLTNHVWGVSAFYHFICPLLMLTRIDKKEQLSTHVLALMFLIALFRKASLGV